MAALSVPLAQGRISPSTTNLMIGKGIVLAQRTNESQFYHLGNCPSVSITPKTELLDHFSAQQTSLVRDFQAIVKKSMDWKMQMEEMTARNLSLLLLGDVDNTNPRAPIVNLFTEDQVTAHVKFYATNAIGPRWQLDLPSVQFNPNGAFEPIGDKYNSVEVNGSVNSADGVSWGTATLMAPLGTLAPQNVLLPFIDDAAEVEEAEVGETLVAYAGAWLEATLGVTYQWNKNGHAIGGATGTTYIPVVGDIGGLITVTVTATNSIGSTSATSAATTAVIAAD